MRKPKVSKKDRIFSNSSTTAPAPSELDDGSVTYFSVPKKERGKDGILDDWDDGDYSAESSRSDDEMNLD